MIFHFFFFLHYFAKIPLSQAFMSRPYHLINCKNTTGSLMVLNLVFCLTHLTLSVY